MVAIWSPETRFKIWFEIEAHACDAQAALGVIPKANAEAPARTKFTFSIAGGVRAYFSERFGLRLEARWAPVYLFSTGPGGCDWDFITWTCVSRDTGHVIQQSDFRLGAIYRF